MAELIYYNPNPYGEKVGDCVIRAISAATGQDWDTTYTGLAFQGFALKDMPSSNYVWGEYLKSRGFERGYIPHNPHYTVSDFADDHPHGAFVLGTGVHAVAVIDGLVLDSWDSRDEIPIFFYFLEE